MKFRIGQLFLQVSMSKEAVIVVPIGEHMIAIRISMFDQIDFNSVRTEVELYHRHDLKIASNVAKWLKEIEN